MFNLHTLMLDYGKTREEADRRRQQLTERKQEIAKEQADLLKEAADIDQELFGLNQILEGVKYVQQSPPPDLESPGMTDHIRTILQRTTVPLLPTQIRASLKVVGIAGSSDKNLLISVHTVLERLRPYLEETKIEGKTAYRWKPEAIPPSGIHRSLHSQLFFTPPPLDDSTAIKTVTGARGLAARFREAAEGIEKKK